jgi:hypothetical protein
MTCREDVCLLSYNQAANQRDTENLAIQWSAEEGNGIDAKPHHLH